MICFTQSNCNYNTMDKNPKTRQEKKGTGKFYGKNGPEVYTQKHIRAHEQLRGNIGKTQENEPVITKMKPSTNKRNKR